MSLSTRRPRSKSSSLGGELRGDTGASALSTIDPTPTFASPPLTPRPSTVTKPARRSKRRKVRSLFRRWKDLSFRHTWINPLIVIIAILSAYLVRPDSSNPLHAAIFLSYPLRNTHPLVPHHAIRGANAPTYYGKGPLDCAFVAFYVIVLSFTRELTMQRVFRPMAMWFGIRSRAKQNRFMEQAYTALYFGISGPLGVYVMSRTPVWYFNTVGMYTDFPHRSHEGLFKAYYLLQGSYWTQQAIVLCLQLEKPRKDFKELVGHHIITLTLISASYRFHFTYIGLAVYITHDISDFFLASSKVLNYISSPITVPYFSFFVLTWTYLRHYLNIIIIISTFAQFRTVGSFDLNWETEQYKCWISQYIIFLLLTILQCMNLFWLYFIIKIAFTVVSKHVAKDVRSDDEEDDEDDVPHPKAETDMNGKESMNGSAKALENEKISANGFMNQVNGHTPTGHDSFAAAVVEGKKDS